ncbi:MAG: carbohydrate ABC transporter permease [Propionicimonas sp.]|nr:carbohydrate ABC transporter permease [Propionicimonas sp.]
MKRYTLGTLALEIAMIAVAAVVAFPLYVLVNLSLREPNDPTPDFLPTMHPTFQNYLDAWQQAALGSAIVNSMIVTVVSVAVIVVVSALATYPLVRLTSRLSTFAFWFVLAGLLLPFQVALIPLYQTMRDLGLLGSAAGLILFYSGLQVPFSVFLYAGFLRALPREFEEAAAVDGANVWVAFWRVVFPILRPVTGTVVILNAIFIWNDFLTPLLYLSGSDQQTIPVALYTFLGQYVSSWPLVFAGLVIGLAPILVAYFLMQRTIIRGFAGGLKG